MPGFGALGPEKAGMRPWDSIADMLRAQQCGWDADQCKPVCGCAIVYTCVVRDDVHLVGGLGAMRLCY